MKQLVLLALLIVGGLLAWLFGSRLSTDALGMAVGLVFGVLASVPTALLVLASNRRRPVEDEDDVGGYTQPVVQNPPLLAERVTVTERVYAAPGTPIQTMHPTLCARSHYRDGRWADCKLAGYTAERLIALKAADPDVIEIEVHTPDALVAGWMRQKGVINYHNLPHDPVFPGQIRQHMGDGLQAGIVYAIQVKNPGQLLYWHFAAWNEDAWMSYMRHPDVALTGYKQHPTVEALIEHCCCVAPLAQWKAISRDKLPRPKKLETGNAAYLGVERGRREGGVGR